MTQITFIGGGHIGRALVGGLISAGAHPSTLTVCDRNDGQLERARALGDLSCTKDSKAATANAEVVVLSINPQFVEEVCRDIADVVRRGEIAVICVAAGIHIDRLCEWLGGHQRIVRVMPNTPAMIGRGAAGLYARDDVDATAREHAESIMAAVGEIVWLAREEDIDAVTAVSGSGPAYFYYLMECMQAAAEEFGLDAQAARLLIAQTAAGAAEMTLQGDLTLKRMRMQVATRGGTTEAAINVLLGRGFKEAVADAVRAARQRSIELSHPNEK